MTERLQRIPGIDRAVSGRRVVVTVYLAVLAVAGLLGALIGLIQPVDLDPRLFFVVELPGTALGMATFGVVTVGTTLGVLLLAVEYASRFDSERVE